MALQWYEPFSFSEWLKRTFSFLNLAVFFITVLFFVSELRFDWFENFVGGYLASTNESRPKTGVIWETGRQTASAHEYLNEMINKQQDTRHTIHTATSFSQLVSGILPGEWVTLEKDHFQRLYLALAPSMAARIIGTTQLVWLLKGSLLDRIFCEGISGGSKIYFIDSENRVIHQIKLSTDELLAIEKGESAVAGQLADMEGFSSRIFSAHDFFEAVSKLPPDILPDLMVNPERLLSHPGRIVKVGIWNTSQDGYIQLGFEFQVQDASEVIFLKGREWAVWQLSLYLRGEGA